MLGLGFDSIAVAQLTVIAAAPPPPFNLTPPQISGSGEVGTALTAGAGTWLAGGGLALDWAWQRDGADIAGATGSGATVAAFVPDETDAGAAIRLRVTATDFGGSVTAFSDVVTPFLVAPAASPGSWTLSIRRDQPMTPFDATAGFSGSVLGFGLAPGSDPLPAGLALSGAGVLSGVPTETVSAATVVLRAANAAGTADKTVLLTVSTAAILADYAAGTFLPDGATAVGFSQMHAYSRPGAATRLDPAGAIEILAADAPRFDHDPLGTPLGLLLEPAASNLLLDSEAVAGTWSTTAALSTAPAGLSVRGRWSGLRLVSGGNEFGRIQQQIDVVAGVPVPIKLFCVPGSSGALFVQLREVASGASSRLRGPLGALFVFNEAAGGITDIRQTDAPDGVAEIEFVYTPDFTGALLMGLGPDSGISGEDIVLLAAQTGHGSYIPTTIAAADRGADDVVLSGIAPGIYDIRLVYGDGSVETLAGYDLADASFPPLSRDRLGRLEAHPPPFLLLRLSDDAPLRLETGAAAYLETPA